MAPHHAVDGAGRGDPVHRAVGRGDACVHGVLARGHPRQPGLARRAGARLPPAPPRPRRVRALGSLVVAGIDHRRVAVGCGRGRAVPGLAGPRGAAHRLPVRRRDRRPQSHGRLQAVVLRLRAAGAAAADRARRVGSRHGAPVHRDRDDGGARVPAGLRPPPERRAHPFARDPPRERRPHRRIAGADPRRARRARHRRDREPRQEPVPRGRQPRPAPAAACDGPVRRGARHQGARAGTEAARQQHPRVGGCARSAVRAAPRPVASRRRRPRPGARRRPAAAAAVEAARRIRAAGSGRGPRTGGGGHDGDGRQRSAAARADPAQPGRQCAALHPERRRGGRRAPARRRPAHRRDRQRHRHRARDAGPDLRRVRPGRPGAAPAQRRQGHGARPRDRPPPGRAARASAGGCLAARLRLALFGAPRARAGAPAATRSSPATARRHPPRRWKHDAGRAHGGGDRRRPRRGRRDAGALHRVGRHGRRRRPRRYGPARARRAGSGRPPPGRRLGRGRHRG